MSSIKVRDLIKELLEFEDLEMEVEISVDISTGEHDCHRRVFAGEYLGVNSTSANARSAVLLFQGEDNEDAEECFAGTGIKAAVEEIDKMLSTEVTYMYMDNAYAARLRELSQIRNMLQGGDQ